MKAIQPFGFDPCWAYTRSRSGAQGFALSERPGGPATPSSALPLAALQGLLALQELRGIAGLGQTTRVGGRVAVGEAPDVRTEWPRQSAAGAGAKAGPGAEGAFVASGYERYVGRSAGSGQCVALVQAAHPDVGLTRTWAPGAPVRGDTGLTPGTVIATFDGSGRYANATDGTSHAAIYLGQDERGIQVLDQWAGSPAAVRTIPWSNPGGTAVNTGGNYRVVVHSA